MKEFLVKHADQDATYFYFMGEHAGKYMCTLAYYNREKNPVDADVIILRSKLEHFIADTEQEARALADRWVKENLGPHFSVEQVPVDQALGTR